MDPPYDSAVAVRAVGLGSGDSRPTIASGVSTLAERRRASLRRLFESPKRASADSRQTGEQLIANWAEIEGRLAALIGPRGVEALFSRSLHLTGRSIPSLAGLNESTAIAVTFGDVAARLIALEPAPAREASHLLLLTFTDLLASLIGDSLTERLLGPIWMSTDPLPTPHEEAIRT